MVKYSVNTWDVEEPQNNFTHLQNLHISAPHEEKLHIGCLRPPGTCNHMPNQKEEKERRTTHGFLRKCQPPACPGNPVATTDRSGRTQCRAEKTGIVEQVTRWQDSRTGQKGGHPHLAENHSAQMNKVKAAAAIAWRVSPPCQQIVWRSHVPDGTDNMQLSSPPRRYIQEGKKAKVVTVTLSNL